MMLHPGLVLACVLAILSMAATAFTESFNGTCQWETVKLHIKGELGTYCLTGSREFGYDYSLYVETTFTSS
jgi:hypothetical protein